MKQFRKGAEVTAGGKLRIVTRQKPGDPQVWCRLPDSDGQMEQAFPAHLIKLADEPETIVKTAEVVTCVKTAEVVTCLNGMRVHVSVSQDSDN